jgi:hypothetical protein
MSEWVWNASLGVSPRPTASAYRGEQPSVYSRCWCSAALALRRNLNAPPNQPLQPTWPTAFLLFECATITGRATLLKRRHVSPHNLRVKTAALLLTSILFATLVWANWPEHSLPINVVADRLVVEKAARRLSLVSRGDVVKVYRVSLGPNPIGKKEREGDGRTPEGLYHIDLRKDRTCCFRSLEISYPNSEDRRRAAAARVNPGGLIMVHGLGRGCGWLGKFHRLHDWTDGCVAVTNQEMAELWRAVPVGTPIELRP